MKTIFLALLILVIANISFAETKSTIKVQYGVGFDSDKVFDDNFRSINVGYYAALTSPVSYTINAGWYGDNDADLSTGYACAQFGASLRPFKQIFVENYFGPCYFHKAQGNLSGHLQFATNIGIGWRDPNTGSEIGAALKHFSNAGRSKPNVGVNLVMLSIAFGI